MSTEQRLITVTAYRDKDGRPTCVDQELLSFNCCRFLKKATKSSSDKCLATGENIIRVEGYLRPIFGCPVWSET